jgi:RNA polymerase sigma-70 factor (ECF subfamily)
MKENWTMKDDSRLLEQIILGDAGAFEKLFKNYFRLLVDFCFRFVEDLSVAKNIVQEVFLKIWANRAKLDPEVNIKYYLYRAVKNKSLNHLRHLKVVKRSAEDVYLNKSPGKTPEENLSEDEIVELLIKAIEELPEKCKIVFFMSKYDKLKYPEIAAALDISIKSVEYQMRRALKFLRKHLSRFYMIFIFFLWG